MKYVVIATVILTIIFAGIFSLKDGGTAKPRAGETTKRVTAGRVAKSVEVSPAGHKTDSEIEAILLRRRQQLEPVASAEEVEAFLRNHPDNPKSFLLACLLSKNERYLARAFESNDPSVVWAYLVHKGGYIQSPELIGRLRELDETSLWPELLSAHVAAEKGDAAAALKSLQEALKKEMVNYSDAYKDLYRDFLSKQRGLGEAELEKYNDGLLRWQDMDRIWTKFFLAVQQLAEKNPVDPLAARAAVQGMGVADHILESYPMDLASYWTIVDSQRILLKSLGPAAAQPALNGSYEEVLAELQAARKSIGEQSRQYREALKLLTDEERALVRQMAREEGEMRAWEYLSSKSPGNGNR